MKKKKIFLILKIVIFLGLALGLIGSIISYLDFTIYEDFGDSYYSYNEISYPESGIIPTIATIMSVVEMLLVFVVCGNGDKRSNIIKNDKKWNITIIIFGICTSLMYFFGVFVIHDKLGYIGWYICCCAAVLVFFEGLIGGVYSVVYMRENKDNQLNNMLKMEFIDFDEYYNNSEIIKFNKCADLLFRLKSLESAGAISENEFNTEKDSILDIYKVFM